MKTKPTFLSLLLISALIASAPSFADDVPPTAGLAARQQKVKCRPGDTRVRVKGGKGVRVRCRRRKLPPEVVPTPGLTPHSTPSPGEACNPPPGFSGINHLSDIKDRAGKYYLCADIAGERMPLEEFEGILDGGGHSISFSIQSADRAAGGLVEILRPNGQIVNLHIVGASVRSNGFAGLIAAVSAGTIKLKSIERSSVCSPNPTYAGIVGLRFGGIVSVEGIQELSIDECAVP